MQVTTSKIFSLILVFILAFLSFMFQGLAQKSTHAKEAYLNLLQAYQNGEHQVVLKHANILLKNAHSSNKENVQGDTILFMAQLYSCMTYFKLDSSNNFREGLKKLSTYKKHNVSNKGLFLFYISKAREKAVQKQYRESLPYLDSARKKAEEMNNHYFIGYSDILYAEYSGWYAPKAQIIPLYKRAVNSFQKSGSPKEACIPLGNIAELYLQEGNLDSAKFFAEEELKLSKEYNQHPVQVFAYTTLAEIAIKGGEGKKGLKLLNDAVRIIKDKKLDYLMVNILPTFAQVHAANGQYLRAAKEVEDLLANPNFTGGGVSEIELLKNLVGYYEKAGEPALALKTIKRLHSISDSLFTLEKWKAVNEISAKSEAERLRFEKKLSEAEIDKLEQRQITYGVSFGAILLVLTTGLLFQRNKRLKAETQAVTLLEKEAQERLKRTEADLEIERLRFQNEEEQMKQIILEQELLLRDKKLVGLSAQNTKKKEILEGLKDLQKTNQELDPTQKKLIKDLQTDLKLTENWEVFQEHFENLNPDFFKTLIGRFPTLTATDLRLAAYFKLNMTTKEIAHLMGQRVESTTNSRSRLRKKFGLNPEEDLVVFLNQIG